MFSIMNRACTVSKCQCSYLLFNKTSWIHHVSMFIRESWPLKTVILRGWAVRILSPRVFNTVKPSLSSKTLSFMILFCVFLVIQSDFWGLSPQNSTQNLRFNANVGAEVEHRRWHLRTIFEVPSENYLRDVLSQSPEILCSGASPI